MVQIKSALYLYQRLLPSNNIINDATLQRYKSVSIRSIDPSKRLVGTTSSVGYSYAVESGGFQCTTYKDVNIIPANASYVTYASKKRIYSSPEVFNRRTCNTEVL
jgi:hypothetical protein